MRNLTIDIALSLLLATGILLWHNRPASPIHLEFSSATATEITPQEPCIVLFWDWKIKSSHRAIQLFQRFHQAHPDINVYFIHNTDRTQSEINAFLVNLGVYTTPMYNEHWPSQIPTTILLSDAIRQDLHHTPHYTQLMEFFDKEY